MIIFNIFKEFKYFFIFAIYSFVLFFCTGLYFKEEILIFIMQPWQWLTGGITLLCTGLFDVFFGQLIFLLWLSSFIFIISISISFLIFLMPTLFQLQVIKGFKVGLKIIFFGFLYFLLFFIIFFYLLYFIFFLNGVDNYFFGFYIIELRLLDYYYFYIFYNIVVLISFIFFIIVCYYIQKLGVTCINKVRYFILFSIMSLIILFAPPDFFLHIFIFILIVFFLEFFIFIYCCLGE